MLLIVLQIPHNRNLLTGEKKKDKARSNMNGSQMEKGVDYTESHAPVRN